MGLSLGWKANDIRDSFWKGDPAFRDIPAAALSEWQKDGDASHLARYALNGQPTRIQFRNLTLDETRAIQSYFVDDPSQFGAYRRACALAFRIAVSFPDSQDDRMRDQAGQWHPIVVRERGVKMLADEYVNGLDTTYPGIIDFYGGKILESTMATDAEKKASSPPSTPTPSSAEESTAATTDASPSVGAA